MLTKELGNRLHAALLLETPEVRSLPAAASAESYGRQTSMSQKYSLCGCGTLTQVSGNDHRSNTSLSAGTSERSISSLPSIHSWKMPSGTPSADAARTCTVVVNGSFPTT